MFCSEHRKSALVVYLWKQHTILCIHYFSFQMSK
uniref:Uncharacterized protein n=1 Tax=Anguilla anguilla TaxID=7936 RepID=A0A0E9PPL8_ANGAN